MRRLEPSATAAGRNMAGDAVKLQAQMHKLQAQLDEVTKDRDNLSKGAAFVYSDRCFGCVDKAYTSRDPRWQLVLNFNAEMVRVKDLNRRGDAELRKAEGLYEHTFHPFVGAFVTLEQTQSAQPECIHEAVSSRPVTMDA